MVSLTEGRTLPLVPNVVVVDPQFQAYGPLVAAARAGRLHLHLRATGAEALKLARRLDVDAWLVSPELDDMSGYDFVSLLEGLPNRSSLAVAMVTPADVEKPHATGAATFSHPIALDSLEAFLRSPSEKTPSLPVSGTSRARALLTLPIGVGAAMLAIAVLVLR
jgi:DNA-binding response OmpR family regulator